MVDEDSMLMQLCTENVYNDNIFHLLNLQTTATPRQIRRRREDLESAHEMGEETWKREFGHLLGNRPVPTFEEVRTAFEHLEDPECRIVSEFFWMWPLDEDDIALKELAKGRRSTAIKIWEQSALGFGEKRLEAQHNLAVLYQFYAIDAELQAIDLDDDPPADFHKTMCDYWERSFEYWEKLADNDDFWGVFEVRMRKFDDPRLSGDFTRRFRQQFPIAFDNINAQIAARYAKASRFDEAKRHIDYMARTMSGLDDIQENMNIIFIPIEQRVKMLVDGYDDKVKANPKSGLEYANKLLEDTEEIRHVAEGMLKDGQRIKTGLFTSIVSACNRYQVQYGNKTEDWKSCLELLTRLKDIACTPESKKVVDGNIETVKNNIDYEKRKNTCWFCGNSISCDKCYYEIKLYGDAYYTEFDPLKGSRYKYKEVPVKIPCCDKCRSRYSVQYWVEWIANASQKLGNKDTQTGVGCCLGIVGGIIGTIIGLSKKTADVGSAVEGFFLAAIGTYLFSYVFVRVLASLIWILWPFAMIHDIIIGKPKYTTYPEYAELMRRGYKEDLKDVKIGFSPTVIS